MGRVDDLYREHERLLRVVCARMLGDEAEADDIVQETFVRMLTRPPSGEVRPWLVKVARNLAIDRMRRRGRTDVAGDLENLPPDDPTDEVLVADPEQAMTTRQRS